MSMRSAEQEGLEFNGATANQYRQSEIDRLKARAAEVRKLGFRAKAVKSGAKEWGCGCYVLMVEPAYFDYEEAQHKVTMIQSVEATIDKIRREAEEKIAQLEKEVEEAKAECDKFGIEY